MQSPLARTFTKVLVGVILVIVAGPPDCLPSPQDSDPDRQLAHLRKRAEMGYEEQQIELAAAYMMGRGVPKDYALAAKWYEKAAGAGDVHAQTQIAFLYEYGVGVRTDPVRAFHWFQLASASGFPHAKVNLGVCYLKGVGVHKNTSRARELFLESANKGSGAGATFVGLMEYFGMGRPVDKAAAERWFTLGSRLNDPIAGFNLVHLYAKDEGHPRDLHRIFQLLRPASKRGDIAAKHCLGLLLLEHLEMAESGQEARVLLDEASNAGNWKSTVLLGIMARDGLTMSEDPSRAYYHFYLAQLQGRSPARHLLEADLSNLRQKLSKEERQSIEAHADEWFSRHVLPVVELDNSPVGRNFPVVAGVRPEPSE